MFMKKIDGQTTEHLLGIFASLLRLLPANSGGRIRTLAKFVEKDYQKIGKLATLRKEYASRVAIVDEQIREEQSKLDAEEREDMADEWDSRRLDAGLFCLQTIDIVLAWLIAEDEGASKTIRSLLKDPGLAAIKLTIQEQLDTISGETEEETTTKDMLNALAQFL